MLLFPKPTKRVKKKKRLSRRGEKTDQWERTRAGLVVRFERAGITECELRYEGCFRNNFLSFAHRFKRRYITEQAELETVILSCQNCHDAIEYRRDMYEIVTGVIARRKVQP